MTALKPVKDCGHATITEPPVRSNALRYKGFTPSKLLEKVDAIRTKAMLGKAPSSYQKSEGRPRIRPPGGTAKMDEILLSSQETDFRGYPLEK